MNKLKIKLITPEDVAEFLKICNRYISDINVYSGSIAVDAKSIISMYRITDGKEIFVEMISSDEREIERFQHDITEFIISANM